MNIVLEKSFALSQGEISHLERKVGEVIKVIPPTATVSLEGPPIYLNQPWGNDHSLGYNNILNFTHYQLIGRGSQFVHRVLVDDYTVEPIIHEDEYLSRIQPPFDRVVKESEFVPEAERLMCEIAGRGVKRLDGRPVALITESGRMACAALDAAFQGVKEADFNIIIHPIQFKHEQEEMRMVLLTARGRLPATFVNIFFKGRDINRVYVTSPEGETQRAGLL